MNTWFTGPRCAVVGTGVSQKQLSEFASELQVGTTDAGGEPARYFAGEIRKERSSPLASVAVAVEGAGFNKQKEAIAFAVLQRAAGTGPHVKWGSSAAPLYQTVGKAAGSDPFTVSSFNASYSDSGLFGFVLVAPGNIAGTVSFFFFFLMEVFITYWVLLYCNDIYIFFSNFAITTKFLLNVVCG